jgi:hypothetical protein
VLIGLAVLVIVAAVVAVAAVVGAESASSVMPGCGVASAGCGLAACAALVDWPPAPTTAATATTAATMTSTAKPINTWVDRRHVVGRMTLPDSGAAEQPV